MQELQRVADLVGDAEKGLAIDRRAAHGGGDRPPVDELGDEDQRVAGGRDLDDVDDRAVIERRAEADLADQRLALGRIARKLPRQDLHGDVLAVVRVLRFPDGVAEAVAKPILQQQRFRGLLRGHCGGYFNSSQIPRPACGERVARRAG